MSEGASTQWPSFDRVDFAAFPEDTDSQSSAMELLDPHIPVLSQYWLAALKDKAYLFLPAEFSKQLPLSSGMFYSVDVMEDVKQYYDSNWSSLLHAAAIWCQERGFDDDKFDDDKKSVKKLPPPLLLSSDSSTKASSLPPLPDPKIDTFHLILGLAVQSICTPATLDRPHVLLNCLRALRKLLSSHVAQDVLSSDARLSIEILNVLHRLLLTSQSLSAHVMAFHISSLVGNILQSAIKNPTSVSVPTKHPSDVGDSADPLPKDLDTTVPVSLESDIEAGKSCVYALLQLATCSLLRLIPGLKLAGNPAHVTTSFNLTQFPKKEELILILHSMKVLVTASSLCAPEASLVLLPPVLHMLLSSLGYISRLPNQALNLVPDLLSVGLQSLSQLCGSLPMSHDLVGPKLGGLLQSALFSVLGKYVEKEGSKDEFFDMTDETRLVVVAVLLHSSSINICPSSSELFKGCVSLFENSLHSKDSKVIREMSIKK